jgi:endonuclease/exonuclease/phosphatase family metal-dependent hydrolase
MKHRILFFIVLTVINISAQVQLKVITYNIMGMKPGTDPPTRLYHIIQNLKVLNPDIIGLQEINESLNGGGADNQAMLIADSLSVYFGTSYYYYYSQTHLSWNNQFKEFIGIISKYPVEQQGFYQLVPGAFPRKVVWNLINTPLGKINFFNTHFDYQSVSVRLQQATQTVSYITQQENQYQSIATILTGDFNDTPGTSPINYILNANFWDTFAEANPGIPGYTVPSNAPTSKIDYVFYHDIDSLNIIVEQNLGKRKSEIPKVEKIIQEELDIFFEWYNSLEAAPTIKTLRDYFESIRSEEVEKNINKFSEDDKEKLEIITKRIINKILHHPTIELRKISESDLRVEDTAAKISIIRDLFGLNSKNKEDK